MAIKEILDHATRAKNRLPGFMGGATNMDAFIDALVAESQNLETVFFDLLDERHLSVAVGAQLDGLGQILDLERTLSETDVSYRIRLVARIGELSRGGEIEALLAAFITLTGLVSPDQLIINEVYPASIIMTRLTDDVDPQDPTADAQLVSAMNDVRAGGVRLDIMRNGVTNSFEFSDESELVGISGPTDVDRGFGDESLTDGGGLSRVL